MLVVTVQSTESPPTQPPPEPAGSTNGAQFTLGAGGTAGFGPSVRLPAAMKPCGPKHVVPAGPVAWAAGSPNTPSAPSEPTDTAVPTARRVNLLLIYVPPHVLNDAARAWAESLGATEGAADGAARTTERGVVCPPRRHGKPVRTSATRGGVGGTVAGGGLGRGGRGGTPGHRRAP